MHTTTKTRSLADFARSYYAVIDSRAEDEHTLQRHVRPRFAASAVVGPK